MPTKYKLLRAGGVLVHAFRCASCGLTGKKFRHEANRDTAYDEHLSEYHDS